MWMSLAEQHLSLVYELSPFWFPIKVPTDSAATERGKYHMPQVWILDKFVKHTKIMERNSFCKVQFACWTFSEMGPEMVSSTVSAQHSCNFIHLLIYFTLILAQAYVVQSFIVPGLI